MSTKVSSVLLEACERQPGLTILASRHEPSRTAELARLVNEDAARGARCVYFSASSERADLPAMSPQTRIIDKPAPFPVEHIASYASELPRGALLVVDYLELLTFAEHRRRTRAAELVCQVNLLKEAADRNSLHLLLASSLPRSFDSRITEGLTRADLPSWYEAADTVMVVDADGCRVV